MAIGCHSVCCLTIQSSQTNEQTSIMIVSPEQVPGPRCAAWPRSCASLAPCSGRPSSDATPCTHRYAPGHLYSTHPYTVYTYTVHHYTYEESPREATSGLRPEELSLFVVTSDISPELISCAELAKFTASQ